MMKLKETIYCIATTVTIITALLIAGRIDYLAAEKEMEWQEANSGYEEISTVQWKQESEIPADLEQVEYETDCYEVRICTAYDWGQELVDPDGDVYIVNDPPEFAEGQLVSVMFDNKGTPLDKTDDVVVDLWEFE